MASTMEEIISRMEKACALHEGEIARFRREVAGLRARVQPTCQGPLSPAETAVEAAAIEVEGLAIDTSKRPQAREKPTPKTRETGPSHQPAVPDEGADKVVPGSPLAAGVMSHPLEDYSAETESREESDCCDGEEKTTTLKQKPKKTERMMLQQRLSTELLVESLQSSEWTQNTTNASKIISFKGFNHHQLRMQALLKSLRYEILMWLLIAANCVTLVLATQAAETEPSENFYDSIFAVECILSVIFVIEVMARLWAFGTSAFLRLRKEAMFHSLDALIVLVTNVIVVFILAPTGYNFLHDDHGGWILRLIMLLRVIRLARLHSIADRMMLCRDLTAFMSGFAGSVYTFTWAIWILLIAITLFATLGVITIAPALFHYKEIAQGQELYEVEYLLESFGTVGRAMRTMTEILAVEHISAKLMHSLPHYVEWGWYFLVIYKAVMDLLCLNLITALVVDNALANSKMAEEREKAALELLRKKEMDQLNDLFLMMDENGDGTLTWDEFKAALKDEQVATKWKQLDFKPDEAKEVFCLLDAGSGEIPIEHFFHGLKKMKGTAQSRDLFRLAKVSEEVVSTVRSLMRLLPASTVDEVLASAT